MNLNKRFAILLLFYNAFSASIDISAGFNVLFNTKTLSPLGICLSINTSLDERENIFSKFNLFSTDFILQIFNKNSGGSFLSVKAKDVISYNVLPFVEGKQIKDVSSLKRVTDRKKSNVIINSENNDWRVIKSSFYIGKSFGSNFSKIRASILLGFTAIDVVKKILNSKINGVLLQFPNNVVHGHYSIEKFSVFDILGIRSIFPEIGVSLSSEVKNLNYSFVCECVITASIMKNIYLESIEILYVPDDMVEVAKGQEKVIAFVYGNPSVLNCDGVFVSPISLCMRMHCKRIDRVNKFCSVIMDFGCTVENSIVDKNIFYSNPFAISTFNLLLGCGLSFN